jgi:NAD(P)-dependent dehydrogenase (short-subunit alcohol dehydrogenase family)
VGHREALGRLGVDVHDRIPVFLRDFFATQAVLPTMIAQKRGMIVSLASMPGKIGSRANLPYNASRR